MPTLEYSLIFGEGRLWGIINGAAFTPRQDAASAFMSQHRHSIEALLRYKETGATVKLIGKDKQKGLDLYVLDLIDKDRTYDSLLYKRQNPSHFVVGVSRGKREVLEAFRRLSLRTKHPCSLSHYPVRGWQANAGNAHPDRDFRG